MSRPANRVFRVSYRVQASMPGSFGSSCCQSDFSSWLWASFCRAITALFSRARELEADAGAARLTGNPAALASALMILSGTPPDTIPLVVLGGAVSLDVFHIVAIGKEYPLVHTHPPLRRCLKQLSNIETRLQSPGPGAPRRHS